MILGIVAEIRYLITQFMEFCLALGVIGILNHIFG
jgi:hypothetical protein